MKPLPIFKIDPPLLNSASPWATTLDDILALYNCPYTGAVTIRTSLLEGFNHDPDIHQYAFFSPLLGRSTATVSKDGRNDVPPDESSSLNTLGYSPIPLSAYLNMLVANMSDQNTVFHLRRDKPIILSVTGSPHDVARCYELISESQSFLRRRNLETTLMMEINLSCPNIPNHPPPAYDTQSLVDYLTALWTVRAKNNRNEKQSVLTGIKTPPYTYQCQYDDLFSALGRSTTFSGGCPISFITATNTLGSCLVLNSDGQSALSSASGEGIGGMAGSALHPLALGNVATIRKMLDKEDALRHIAIIGVGGVSDKNGFQRMRSVGAAVVGVGTALGKDGVDIFEKITKGSEDE